MKKVLVLCSLAFVVLLFVTACSQEQKMGESKLNILEPVLPETVYDYAAKDMPAYLPFDHTTINNNVATLGRVLFYDNALSISNTVACASCHLQQFAFTDGKALSDGVGVEKTKRNAMAIMNMSREHSFFWDLRETNLQTMVTKPIQNHVEMGFDKMDNVVANIKQIHYYKPLFEKAFGTSDVTATKVSMALTQFLSSMKSHHSKYDVGRASQFQNFNGLELLGKELFTKTLYCKSCHFEPDFKSTWEDAANIGLDLTYADNGVGALNADAEGSFENGSFKIPTLRNIELTGPYMHDGRFKTLEEVIEHYNSGVKDHPYLNWNLRTAVDPKTGKPMSSNGPLKLNLSTVEKEALVAFLKTLTDYEYVNDVRFSNPFRVKS
ncbi:MAG: cytochrome c peroxidase [Bacteroidota bacterium]